MKLPPLFVLACVAAAAPTYAAKPSPSLPAPAADPNKTHVFFMGADFQIQYESTLHPVKGVIGSSFVIDAKGKSVKIATDEKAFSMKIQYVPRLTEDSVVIEKLSGEQGYTPETDPNKKWMQRQNSIADMASEAADRAFTQMRGTSETVTETIGGGPGGPITRQVSNPEFAGAQRAYTNASNMARSDIGNSGYYASKLQEELAKKLFDALELSFELTPDKPLDTPYMIVITQFKERDKPNSSKNLIYAKELEPMGVQMTKIKTRQAGFPPGYELEKFQVHIYNAGREIATNVAEKRLLLSADDALQYHIIDHMGKNRGASAPAAWVMGKLPPNVRTLLGEARYAQTYFIQVSKTGQPSGVFTDKACSQKADTEVSAMIGKLRFVPVLEKGKPVDGIAELKISSASI